MTATAAVLQLHHREAFERNVTRSLLAGAGAGVLAFTCRRLGVEVPLSYLAIAGAALVCVRGDKMDRLMLTALSILLPAAPWIFGLTAGWTIALAAAAAGALMVKARICERGEEGSVGADRPGLMHVFIGAGTAGALAVAGVQVANVLAARLAQFSTPPLFVAALSGIIIALFVAIASISAHLALRPDPVEARCEALISQLSGELRTLAARALNTYRQCGRSLAQLPREPAREELARSLARMTHDAVELASDWTGVEAQMEETAHRELASEVAELSRSAAASKDPIARKQLELAADSLREEMDRLGELQLRRERIVAKLKAQVALLDRARVALISLRSGHAQMKAAELSALARKFNALATLQQDEANLVDAVATGAQLAADEASPSAPTEAPDQPATSTPTARPLGEKLQG